MMPARIKAFLIHLTCSMLLAGCALALVFLVWYPAPLAEAFGVTHIFLLMLAIDVIIGPLLTLLVYKVDKKTLKFDLAAILVVQLSMFGYGIHTVAIGRPAWLVFNNDQFYAVRAADISDKNRQSANSEFYRIPLFGPKWAAVLLPEDKKQRKQIILNTIQSGSSLFGSPYLYAPLSSKITNIQKSAHPISLLGQWNSVETLKDVLSAAPTATAWLPLWTDRRSMIVLLDKDGHVISITNLKTSEQ
jgi:hypothetical protein